MSAQQKRKPTRARSEEIVQAAMEIIAMEGSRKFTAQELADRVGITSGGIFRHFDSMEAIVEEVLHQMEATLFGDFPPSGRDPIERLGSFFGQRVSVMLENPMISRLLISDHLTQVSGLQSCERIQEFKRRSKKFVHAQFREAEQAGMLKGAVGVEEGEVLFMGALFGLAHVKNGSRSRKKSKILAERVWQALRRTLHGTPKSKERTKDP